MSCQTGDEKLAEVADALPVAKGGIGAMARAEMAHNLTAAWLCTGSIAVKPNNSFISSFLSALLYCI